MLAAGFGGDAARAARFPLAGIYGFRPAVRTDLGSRPVRARGLAPAAVGARPVPGVLPEGADLGGLVLDRGLVGRAWADGPRRRGALALPR